MVVPPTQLPEDSSSSSSSDGEEDTHSQQYCDNTWERVFIREGLGPSEFMEVKRTKTTMVGPGFTRVEWQVVTHHAP